MKGSTALAATAVALIAIVGLTAAPRGAHNAQAHYARLSWTGSTSRVKAYCVHRGTHHGGPYQRIHFTAGHETNYTDSDVAGGHTYYYVVTAISPSGAESAYSAEVVAVVPGP